MGRPTCRSLHTLDNPKLTGSKTSKLTRLVLTYRQSIFVTVYSHLLCACNGYNVLHFPDKGFAVLDQSSQIWWRWMNIFFTLVIWSIELLVSGDEDSVTKEWKIE